MSESLPISAQTVWITPAQPCSVPVFRMRFCPSGPVVRAVLRVTCLGVYDAEMNGRPVGRFVLAPGWTAWQRRLQVQTYDVTDLLEKENELRVTVAEGWYRRSAKQWMGTDSPAARMPPILIADLTLTYAGGASETLVTDEHWEAGPGPVRTASIFDGETYDANIAPVFGPVTRYAYGKETLIPQEGEEITVQETVFPVRAFTTPRGERVFDFGQELTGWPVISLTAKRGERLSLSCAEVLDKDGNFYTENYRAAKSTLTYICRDGAQTFAPRLTFFGFRYLRADEAPEGFSLENIRAAAVHSDMKRTGWLETAHPLLARLFSNILWGQKGNYLDIPTDCPQRDERLGWTGDAEVFVRTGCLQYDAERFFMKWLRDMAAEQREDGSIPAVIPNALPDNGGSSAGWGDAAAVCPWEVYRAYGDPAVLRESFEMMQGYLRYIAGSSGTPDLWTGGRHYGDWLGLDSPEGSYAGASDKDLIASACYARCAAITADTARVLGQDPAPFDDLHARIVRAFRERWGGTLDTQTDKVLALQFGLSEDPAATAKALAEQIEANGTALQTGFMGTPYLLHALSDNGYDTLAWSLLLREEYPSWLYPLQKGATTMWEHWDGVKPDGSFWSSDMNSFNHYAYGAAADWVWDTALGIRPAEPGYASVRIEPHPDRRAGSMRGVLDTRHGRIESAWVFTEGRVRYEITVPVKAEIVICAETHEVGPGTYLFWSADRAQEGD